MTPRSLSFVVDIQDKDGNNTVFFDTNHRGSIPWLRELRKILDNTVDRTRGVQA